MSSRLVALVLASATFAGACAAPTDTDTTGGTPTEDRIVGRVSSALTASGSGGLGQAYDTVNAAMKPMYCIQPTGNQGWPDVGSASANVSMSLQSDRTQVARSLGIEVEASYGMASASASFYRETQSDARSVAYVFGGSINFKDSQVGGNYEVNPLLVGKSPVEFTRLCGDSYVQKVTRGASLYAGMKFFFSSTSEKETFEAKFSVAGAVSVSTALKAAQSIANQTVSVEVTAVQVNGVPSQLSTALANVDATSCSMGSPESCLGFLNSIEQYAAVTFPSQFLDANRQPLTGAALDQVIGTTGYVSQPWSTLDITNLDIVAGKPEAKALLGLYEGQFATQAKLDGITNMPVLANRSADMAAKQRPQLAKDNMLVAQNVATLDKAWAACVPDVTSTCAAQLASASSLPAPNAENLNAWFDATPLIAGHPVSNFDLVDLRVDGHTDNCTADNGFVVCQMGTGLGFEEHPSRRISALDAISGHPPTAWVKLRGTDLAICAPQVNSDSTLRCVEMNKGDTKSYITLTQQRTGWVDVMPYKNGDANGVVGAPEFKQAADQLLARSGLVFPSW